MRRKVVKGSWDR